MTPDPRPLPAETWGPSNPEWWQSQVEYRLSFADDTAWRWLANEYDAERARHAALVEAAREGLMVLHSPHYGWGCNAANCSGQAALDQIAALDKEPDHE
jgi:hypothetical protein